MRIWLDDVRLMHQDYNVWTKTAAETIELLKTGLVTHISLDHDLGDPSAGTGYDVACFIEQQAFTNSIPRIVWNIHSANPVGVNNMTTALQRADTFWSQYET